MLFQDGVGEYARCAGHMEASSASSRHNIRDGAHYMKGTSRHYACARGTRNASALVLRCGISMKQAHPLLQHQNAEENSLAVEDNPRKKIHWCEMNFDVAVEDTCLKMWKWEFEDETHWRSVAGEETPCAGSS
jgi:hypothetical protein